MEKRGRFSIEMNEEQISSIRNVFPEIFFEEQDKPIEKFKISIESAEAPDILYHYTSIDTLEKILRNSMNKEYILLRGTNIHYLNDRYELDFAIDIMISIAKEFESEGKDHNDKKLSESLTRDRWRNILTWHGFKSDLYITSFSANQDSLPMWNIYGNNGNGIALGCRKCEINNTKNENSKWGKCYYDQEIFKANFQKFFPIIYDNLTFEENKMKASLGIAFNEFSFLFGILKHKSFEFEEEWRLMKDFQNLTNIGFHPSNGILKPFIENKFPKIDLKKIVLGPCIDKEQSKGSVEMLLQNTGFSLNKKDENFVEVLISEAPYRII